MRSIEPGISLGAQFRDSGFALCAPRNDVLGAATGPIFACHSTLHGVVFAILRLDPDSPVLRCAIAHRGMTYVLLPAAVATTGNTSLAARSGVSSFQRTEPNGRSSMRRTRIGCGPTWKSIAR